MLPLFRIGLGGAYGSGTQWLSWISLHDEVHAMLFALEHAGLRGPVNGCAPNPVTNREFTRDLGRLLHRPTVATVPRVALGIVLGRDLAAETPLASQRALPECLEKAGYRFAHPTVTDALAAVLAEPR
jgi:NAD dependent epimerase/dehydratase family enzyme